LRKGFNMSIAELREELRHYIDIADDKKIEAIYTILENDIEHTNQYSPEEIKKFYERRDEHLAGKTETYTMEEAHQYIRQQKK